jgi:hypothetical protein
MKQIGSTREMGFLLFSFYSDAWRKLKKRRPLNSIYGF